MTDIFFTKSTPRFGSDLSRMQRRPDDVLVEIFEGDCLVVLLPEVPDERPEVVFGLRRLGKHVHRDLEDDGLPGGHRLSNVGIDCVVVPIKKKNSADVKRSILLFWCRA